MSGLSRPGRERAGSNTTIRAASAAHLPDLLDLESSSFSSDRISPRQMRHLLTRAHATVLIAQCADRLVGSVVVLYRRGARVGRVYSLAVDAAARGRGIGAALLEAAAADATRRGNDRLRLEVRQDNGAAIALYERLGFRRIAEIDDYYQDHMAAWRFERPLAGSHP